MKITKHKNINNLGFTLIEVLISILLLSILMVYVLNIVDDSSQTKDSVLAEDADLLQVETAYNRLQQDLESIYSPAYFSAIVDFRKQERLNSYSPLGGFERSERFPEVTHRGHPVPFFDNPDNQTFIFFTSVNRRKSEDIKQSDFAWVKYTLESSEREDKNIEAPYDLVRYYSPNNPYFTENDWDNIKPNLLMTNVKKIEFLFWHSARKKFVTSLKEINDERYTPRLFQVNITWIDVFGEEHIEKRVMRPLWNKFDLKTEQAEIDKILKSPVKATANPSSKTIIKEKDEEIYDE